MTRVVPFLLEHRPRAAGGRFESGGVFSRYVVVDGNLVTGQNPASSIAVAEAMTAQLQRRAARGALSAAAPPRRLRSPRCAAGAWTSWAAVCDGAAVNSAVPIPHL